VATAGVDTRAGRSAEGVQGRLHDQLHRDGVRITKDSIAGAASERLKLRGRQGELIRHLYAVALGWPAAAPPGFDRDARQAGLAKTTAH